MNRVAIRGRFLFRQFSRIIYQRIVLILTLLLCLVLAISVVGSYIISNNLVDFQAMHYAHVATRILDKARVQYSKTVVDKVKTFDNISVIAEYHSLEGAIPNPATFTIELAEELTQEFQGALFRLYSQYPFPNRRETGGAQDKFEWDALNFLMGNPDEFFYRKEKKDGIVTFRYAEPVKMEASCIACHNYLTSSPKKDWQVGDVRGVIEVNQPLNQVILIANNGLKIIYVALSIIIIIAITSFTIVIAKLYRNNQELEEKVADRTKTLKVLATTDELTKLANRRQFNVVFREECQRACRHQTKISIILCDIDYFKKFNDTYGHQAGDNCIRSVAKVLKNTVKRSGELVARYGGEEFIILLPNVNKEETIVLAETILHNLAQLGLYHQSSLVSDRVTLSMGIATMYAQQDISRESLIKLADDNLYYAKEKGRNRFYTNG